MVNHYRSDLRKKLIETNQHMNPFDGLATQLILKMWLIFAWKSKILDDSHQFKCPANHIKFVHFFGRLFAFFHQIFVAHNDLHRTKLLAIGYIILESLQRMFKWWNLIRKHINYKIICTLSTCSAVFVFVRFSMNVNISRFMSIKRVFCKEKTNPIRLTRKTWKDCIKFSIFFLEIWSQFYSKSSINIQIFPAKMIKINE